MLKERSKTTYNVPQLSRLTYNSSRLYYIKCYRLYHLLDLRLEREN